MNCSFSLPERVGQEITLPLHQVEEFNGLDRLRSEIIKSHLEAKNSFRISLSEIKFSVDLSVQKIAASLLTTSRFWMTIAKVIRDVALVAFTLIGSYFLFENAKSQLAMVGNESIRWNFGKDYSYSSTFSQADYNRRFLSSGLLLVVLLGVSLRNLKNSVSSAIQYARFHIKQLQTANDKIKIQAETVHPVEVKTGNLLNQLSSRNLLQDPITLEGLEETKVLSPAVLIVRNMAFSMEKVMPLIFFRAEDERVYPEFYYEEKLILKHPYYRDPLIYSDQESVIQQICNTFLITPDGFISCWRNVAPSTVPSTKLSDAKKWYQKFRSLSDEEMKALPTKLEEFQKMMCDQDKYEYGAFLQRERGAYMQMIRFNNFCKLLPEETARALEETLTEGFKEKLSRVKSIDSLSETKF